MPVGVKISGDSMEATAKLERRDSELTVAAVNDALKAAGVHYGIDEHSCLELIAAINAKRPGSLASGIVAQGLGSVPGEDGTAEMIVEYGRDSVGQEDESGSIDFRDRGSFTSIEKDQVIAKLVPPTPGTPGRNVQGSEVAATPGRPAKLTAGPGTVLSEGGTELRATRPGDLNVADDRIEVTETIRVAGNLDYEMGSIECTGAVRVEGDLLPGFYIHAGGDVTIEGVVDSAEVRTEGALVVRQGVLPGSRIYAKGDIKVGYVSNSSVEGGADITILRESLHSRLIAGGSITIPGAGRVLGGNLEAAKQIEVGVAGHIKGLPTTLAAGVKAANKESLVRVNKIIHPGVRLLIGPGELDFKEEHHRSTFQFDLEVGEIAKCAA